MQTVAALVIVMELHSIDDTNKEDESEDWEEVFTLLDPKDGAADGKIHKDAILEWIDTLNFQATVTLEASQGISRSHSTYYIVISISICREKIRWLIETADTDHNKYIDKEEFLILVRKHSRELEKIQRNNFLKYLRVAAYADEYRCVNHCNFYNDNTLHRWWPPPFFILLLTTVQISIFVYHYTYFTSLGVPVTWSGPPPICSILVYNPGKRYQAWRFFTYSFVHSGIEHIFVNIILQLLVGPVLEMTNSWWRVGLVYVVGVVSGSLAMSVIHPEAFLAGASGGVYALACAHLAAILLNWREDSLILRQRLRNKKATSPTFGKIVRVGRVLVVGGIIGVDIVTAIASSVSGVKNSTSYTAHTAGVVMGMLVGIIILKNRRVQFWEQWLRLVSCTLAAVFLLVMIFINIFATNLFIADDTEEADCAQFV